MKKLLLSAAVLFAAFSSQAQNNGITGIVYGDSVNSTQIDTFMVWLITYDAQTNILQAVDSQVVSGQGQAQYAFYNNPAQGSYRTKAAHLNGPTTGTGLLPTYHHINYMNTPILWSNASAIAHPGNTVTFGKHIYMAVGTVTSGPGFIGGNVLQGANKGTANGIEGMNIYLLDANNDPIVYTTTDVNGDYSFSNLPYGTYNVHPENMGDATTDATIVLDATTPSVNDVIFERSNTNKTIKRKVTSIEAVAGIVDLFSVYPNPASGNVNIRFADAATGNAMINMIDLSGKIVMVQEVSTGKNASISVQNFQPGMYFMTIATENGSTTQKLIIE